jgi:hypothetical protein
MFIVICISGVSLGLAEAGKSKVLAMIWLPILVAAFIWCAWFLAKIFTEK